jgi:hypothetical protein
VAKWSVIFGFCAVKDHSVPAIALQTFYLVSTPRYKNVILQIWAQRLLDYLFTQWNIKPIPTLLLPHRVVGTSRSITVMAGRWQVVAKRKYSDHWWAALLLSHRYYHKAENEAGESGDFVAHHATEDSVTFTFASVLSPLSPTGVRERWVGGLQKVPVRNLGLGSPCIFQAVLLGPCPSSL